MIELIEWHNIKWCDLLGYVNALDKELFKKSHRMMKMDELETVSKLQDKGLTPLETANKIIYKRNMIK